MNAASKDELRLELRMKRRTLSQALPFAGDDLVKVFRSADIALPANVALYSRQGSEIDPEPLALWLAGQGVVIALPVVVEIGQPLAFRRMGDVLEPDAYGLPAPLPHEPLVSPDLIFAPLLGFDRRGHRLGQGGGFYDRTLTAHRRRKPQPSVIGLAYAGQEVDRVPCGAHDERLDGVLTEKAYLRFS